MGARSLFGRTPVLRFSCRELGLFQRPTQVTDLVSTGVYSRAPEVPYVNEGRGRAVKKLLLVALAAIGGLLVYRQIQADRAEQDLWTEATDSVPTGS